jgi:outer membrane immunogenic protein
MQRLVVAISLFAAGIAGASAADMAVKAPPPVVAPVTSWTGFYVGVNAGYNWGSSDPSTSITCGPAAVGLCYVDAVLTNINLLGANSRFDTRGGVGGVQAGYNWQSGTWLAGVEVDFDAFRSAGSTSVTGPNPPFAGSFLTIATSVRTDWLFTARPRLGVVWNNWLFYGTGGLAVTNLKANWSYFENTASAFESGSVSTTKVGWTAGAGFEAMLPSRWTVGVEYLYVKFDNVSTVSSNMIRRGVPLPDTTFRHSADLQSNIVRVRLNKLF